MSFISNMGALLGGATEEASKIKQERFQKEQQDLNLTTSMLQHIIENPNILDPSIKAHAQHAWRDVVMEHLFPDQFKKDKKNPISKMVDQFVGQQATGPAMASALQQLGPSGEFSSPGGQPGVGRGNATSQVGAAGPSQQPSVPMPAPMRPQPVSQMEGGPSGFMPQGPPAPPFQQDQQPQLPPTVEGFTDPRLEREYALRQQQQMALETQRKQVMQDLAMLKADPNFKNSSPEHQAQMIAGVFKTNYTILPPREPFVQERYDPESNKTFIDSFKWGETGPDLSKPIKTEEKPPSAKEQEYASDAKYFFKAAQTDPKSPFKGKSESEIRTELHAKDYIDKEIQRQATISNIQSSAVLRKYYEANIVDLIAKRDENKLVQLARDVDREAEKRYMVDVAGWQKKPWDIDSKTNKIRQLPKPDPKLKDQYFDQIAKGRGYDDPDILRKVIGGSLSSGLSKPKLPGFTWMRAPDGTERPVENGHVEAARTQGAIVIE